MLGVGLERGDAFGADGLHGLPQLVDMLGEPGMSGVPDFSGYDWKGLLDGETPPFRLAFEMLKRDLDRLVERAPSRDGAAEMPFLFD